jgi:predicted lipid-binding transport protein (Tim44 family)
LSLLLAGLIALTPAIAEAAKAGGGMSGGSRGSRTFDSAPATPTAPQAAPVQRSVTQPAQPARPAQAAPATAPQAQPSFFQRNPFMAGMMGGLLGAGIGALLFGGGFGSFMGEGAAGMLGMVLQLALIGGLIYLAFAFFARRRAQNGNGEAAPRPAYAYAAADGNQSGGQDNIFTRRSAVDVKPLDIASGRTGSAPASSHLQRDEIGVNDADYAAFEKLLIGIQTAWSAADIVAMRRHLTPEMLSYFSEALSAAASDGIENRVEDVKFENGDLAEAWSEGDLDYATVAMNWTARNYALRAGTDQVIEGSRTERVAETEVWTFIRRSGGNWLLSAIQQTS